MQRVTITIDDELLAALDGFAAGKGYASRSEAVRDIVREVLVERALSSPPERCVATLTYVFDHHQRDLARRLKEQQHDHYELTVASLHVHLDHATCLEVAVMRGPGDAVRGLADEISAQRGVRHGRLHIIPAESAPV